VPADFRVDEDEVDRLAEDAALSFLLDNRHNEVLARFVALNGFDTVRETGFAELARNYALITGGRDTTAGLEKQLAELGRLYREKRSEALRYIGEILSLEPSVGAIRGAQELLKDITLDPDWDPRAADGPPEGVRELETALGSVHKKTGNSRRPEVEAFKEAVDALKGTRNGGTKGIVTELVEMGATYEVREELRELYRLVDEFQSRVRTEKRRRALLSYLDVTELALELLRTDPGLRLYYNRSFSYIMIDEFQDNNELQKELLYLLSLSEGALLRHDGELRRVSAVDLDPRKLFFVGDEKQSIYRFRGADVSVFKRLSAELAESGGEPLELPFNYRSSKALIDFFNVVFRSVMADASADYEARFSALAPPKATSHTVESKITVAYKPYGESGPADDRLGQDEAEAYYVARTIHDAVENGNWPIPTEDGGQRPAGYDDVAILMRSTSNQRHYERMLRLFNVPYSTQSVRSLYESSPAYDVYNLLQLCVYPEDRAAYAAVLRSPLVHVSDEALSRLLSFDGEPFAVPAADVLREGDAERYARGAQLYRHFRERLDQEPISRIVSDIWYRAGYRYKLLVDSRFHPYLEYFDHLYELARTVDEQPAVAFVEEMRAHLGQYGRRAELEVVPDEQRGVQLMTIHKAKGLEFPVVVLANTGNMGRNEGLGHRPFYLSTRFGLTASMPAAGARLAESKRVNYFYTEGERENAALELAELKRLLYVALTRAESHLLVTGVFNSKNRKSRHLLSLLLGSISPAGAPEPGRLDVPVGMDIELIPDVPRSLLAGASRASRGRDPEAALRAYRSAELVARTVTERELSVTELAARRHTAEADGRRKHGREQEPEHEEELPRLACDEVVENRDLATFFGTLTHYLIEISLGAPTVSVPPVTELPPGLRREALRREVTAEEYRLLSADAARLAHGFLDSPLAGELADARIEREVPFVLYRKVGSTPVWLHGQIDLLATYEEPEPATGGAEASRGASRATVLDFKTDRVYEPAAHRLQLALYREAASELTGAPVRAFVYYVRNGRVEESEGEPELSDELLEASNTR
jgi:ATP-dependent exoDNAse (exonuclease V) beta subunit